MKKIVLSVTNDLSFDQRMQRICSSLSDAGYSVTLLGRETKKSLPLQPASYHQKRFNIWFHKGKLFYLEYNLRLFFFLLFHSFDIACAIDTDTIPGVIPAALLKNKKRVFDAHELFPEVPELMGRGLEKKLWSFIEKAFIPFFHSCYTVSEGVAKEYSKATGKEFEVIRNIPVKLPSESKEDKKNTHKIILYQGALNMGRGIEQLIRASKELPVEVWLAGEGDLSAGLRKMVREMELQTKVIFLGKLPPGELRKITPKAWLGYNLLEPKGLSYRLSLSNKFFDYIHAHIPSLSPNFVEYEAINKKHEVALLCDLSVDQIIKSVNLLLKDEDYYYTLVENCKKAADIYSWQQEEKKLINLYKRF